VLSEALKKEVVMIDQLREVQRQREWPVGVIQWFETQVQKRIVAVASKSDEPLQMPGLVRSLLRLPTVVNLPARVLAIEVRRGPVETPV
jgi:hypothetical protein